MLRAVLIIPLFATLLAAADINGIWMGGVEGRNGEKQDIAFQFRQNAAGLSGVMFGDELDLPIEGLTIEGDHLTFYVTQTDYRDRKKTKSAYEGTITADGTIQLSRERPGGAAASAALGTAPTPKQIIVLKRIDR